MDSQDIVKFFESQEKVQIKYLDNLITDKLDFQEEERKTTERIPSVSRLIVFLAGHAAVAIGTCLTSFIIYYKLAAVANTEEIPNLNSFVGVLLALGIGVIPYAVNRITSNKNEGTTNNPS